MPLHLFRSSFISFRAQDFEAQHSRDTMVMLHMLPTGGRGDELHSVNNAGNFQVGRKKPRKEVGGVWESTVWCPADISCHSWLAQCTGSQTKAWSSEAASGFWWQRHKPNCAWRPGALSSSWLVNEPDAGPQRWFFPLSSAVTCCRQKARFGAWRRNGPQGLPLPQHAPKRAPFKLDIQKLRLEFQFYHSTCRVTLGKLLRVPKISPLYICILYIF